MPWRVIVAVLLCSSMFVWAAPAGATSFCVAPASGCGGGDLSTVGAALSAASANAGADDVRLGAATYSDGPWSYVDTTETNPVTIRGAAQFESQLVSAGGSPTLKLTGGSADGVLVYAPPAGVGIVLTSGKLSNSEVLVSTNGRGVDANGATIEGGAIAPAGGGTSGHTAIRAASSTIVGTSLSTTNGVEVVSDPVAVRRSTIVTRGYGLQSGLSQTSISDSQIVLNDPTAVGVEGICDVTTGVITIAATNLTVTGAGNSGIAFRSIGGQLCGGHVAVSSSLVQSVGTSVDCAPGIGSASVAVTYSDVDLAAPGKVTGSCTGAVDAGGNFFADPKLASLATLQPVPRFDSPLVDAGDPAAPGTGQPTDFAGLPRAVNGRRDIGAFEYGRRPPSLTVVSGAASALPNEAVTFTATVSDPDLGDQVGVTWTFDDGGAASGAQVAHAFSTGGTHSATATATDSAGVTAVGTVTVEVRSPALDAVTMGGGSGQVASRPLTTGLKGPKRVKWGRPAIFRFGSSAPGSTFRCAIDRKPFASCESPFKLRTNGLTPGRKHTFSVYAIDPAGNADPTPLMRSFRVSRSRR